MRAFISGLTQMLHQTLLQALPGACALCSKTTHGVMCQPCITAIAKPSHHRCKYCAIALSAASQSQLICAPCLKTPPAFDHTVIAIDYAAPMDQLILALKFGSQLALAPFFATMLRDAMLASPTFSLPTILTMTPLSGIRLAERGFNQSLEIAKPLAKALNIALYPQLLIRTRHTAAQATLPLNERRHNMHKAFLVDAGASNFITGKHIGVVDDVMTTGETLNEIATTLKRFGAARVTNFVFARTPIH